jgi:PcfJ-like protein
MPPRTMNRKASAERKKPNWADSIKADWVRACHGASKSPHGNDPFHSAPGEQFVVRLFKPDMSLKTVNRLSVDWHEAVANSLDGPSNNFPQPWCDAGQVGDYKFVPISDTADLYREGRAMHHCVGTYGGGVRQGETYVYSIRKDGGRVATIQLVRCGDSVSIGQLRGPCNSQVPREIEQTVKKWLRAQKNWRLPNKSEIDRLCEPEVDEIPL